MRIKCLVSVFFLGIITIYVEAQVSLPSIFTNNMVLQQQVDAPIWGKSKPKQKVTIVTSWDNNKLQIEADQSGNWRAKLKTPVAGGPYFISVSTSKKHTVKLENVMIGEVWLCSGQSNMEWRVRNDILNMNEEIAAANYPQIRMITIEKQISITPADDCKVEGEGWKVCSPSTVGDFSAVAYFFGRNIHQSQQVPVGLINSSWGGSLAEVWVDGESLESMPYFRDYVKNLRQLPTNESELEQIYQQNMQNWLKELNKQDPGYENGKLVWADTDFSDKSWYDFSVPGMVQTEGMTQKNGVFWFRKEIEIPKAWVGKELTLRLGTIDDDDFTYYNGILIGKTEGWMANREYKIPANLAKKGKAVIAVRVLDTGGLGGFGGNIEDFDIGLVTDRINLSGNWKAKFSLALGDISLMPRRVDGNMNEPTVLYNAMINPLIPYSIKGAVWYQGESNTGRANQYRDLLPLLVHSWRKQFGNNFSFYIVQLANHMKIKEEPTESTWAELREAQLQALRMDKTGIAVTIDIGEADDIHPRNKQDVGLRLALSARANTYGEKVSFSGPLYKSYKIEGDKIRISFEHADGGLKTPNAEKLKGFAIAGVDHKFHWADAVIDGNDVLVSNPNIEFPVAVRYAWADNPICNLYNGSNLPASPFRTDNWTGITE